MWELREDLFPIGQIGHSVRSNLHVRPFAMASLVEGRGIGDESKGNLREGDGEGNRRSEASGVGKHRDAPIRELFFRAFQPEMLVR